jgi:ADP-heptose:LPS heptosyltransferase
VKILIIRFSSIGDIVLTSPVIRCLRKKFPDAEIHYLTKAVFHPMLAANPYINKFHFLESDLAPVIENLQSEKFDIVIDLHKNIRSLRVKQALEARSYTFDKLNFKKWLIVNLKIDSLPDKHIVDRYFEALAELGVQNDGQGLEYFISEQETQSFSLPMQKNSYIAFAIGAKHNTKKLPDHKIAAICEAAGKHIVLLGGKEEFEAGERMNKLYPEKIINNCGKLNINESAYVIKNAGCVISHDTGMMHIAAAFKKPVISIWGSTVPQFGMYPYYGERNAEAQKHSHIIEVNGLPCRPCSKIGFDKCPKGHFKCMNEIDTNAVVMAMNKEMAGV